MKVVILAGGRGTRLTEEQGVPKPLVEIGGKPILWHIMKHYAHFGYHDFVIAVGHKGREIARWVLDLWLADAPHLNVDFSTGAALAHSDTQPPWRIRVVNTGEGTPKAGRLRRLAAELRGETFMLTYADGLSDVNLTALVQGHAAADRMVTLSAVRPPPRFGRLSLAGDMVVDFAEKAHSEQNWINGGYFVVEPSIFEHLPHDEVDLERQVLSRLAAQQQLGAYRHAGYWQCMDTPREAALLNELWKRGNAPWKLWD